MRFEYDLGLARKYDVKKLHLRNFQIVQPCKRWDLLKAEESLNLLGRERIVLVYGYSRFGEVSCLRLQGSPKRIPWFYVFRIRGRSV